MRFRILGCGTSTGVPVPGCLCEICRSPQPRNKRLRTSAFIEIQTRDLPGDRPSDRLLSQDDADPAQSASDESVSPTEQVVCRLLIDTGPDLRMQLIREDIRELDSVLYTHTHADHIFGIDDLRGICFFQRRTVAGFGSRESVEELRRYFPYIFSPDPGYLGGAPPDISLTAVEPYEPFQVNGMPVTPLPVRHGSLEILGYRIGDAAYLTDCSEIPERTKAALGGLKVLFLSGLRPRPHPTHFSLEQARREAEEIGAAQSYFIHLGHEVDYHTENDRLRSLSDGRIELAYDGLTVDL